MLNNLKIRDKVINVFNYLFTIFFAVIFIKCIFSNRKSIVDFNMRIVFLVSIIFIGLLFGIYALVTKFENRVVISNKYFKIIIYVLTICFIFVIQVFVASSFHYLTGWDAGLVRDSAISLAINGEGNYGYFQHFPNNVMLLWIFKNICSISQLFKNISYEFALVIFNIISIDASVFLIILVSKKIFEKRLTIITSILCAMLLLFTPWMNIPYSDTIGMFFVILIFYIYLKVKECKNNIIKYLLASIIGVVALIGYQIKPTNIIVLIAIVIGTLLYSVKDKKSILNYISICLCIFFAMILTKIVYDNTIANIEVSGVKLSDNENIEVPFTHFLMMGMQERTIEESGTRVYGSYSGDDYEYTLSFETKEERISANIKEVKRRLKNFGVVGYLEFLDNKVNWILHDGTFFYGGEGGFVSSEPIKTNRIAKIIQKYYIPNNPEYNKLAHLYEGVWLSILFFMVTPILKKEHNKEVFVLRLTIVGIILFLMLFEARSRYLINHLPIFILLSVYGFSCICNKKRDILSNYKK